MRLLCLLIPQEKTKVGGRRREQPSLFPPHVSAEGPGLLRARRGRGSRRTNSSQQVQAAAGQRGRAARHPPPPSSPLSPPFPSPPPQARPGRGGRLCTPRPTRPDCGLLGRDSRGGGGAGVPCRRILPRGWRQGEGMEIGEWRIKKDSSSARARPARGILGKKWPRGTGRARRGAGVRGQGPGALRAEPPT